MPTQDWRQQLPCLAGTRLYLREVVATDAVSLFELITQDPTVREHISAPPPSISAFHGFITWCHRERAAGRSICFGVVPQGLEHAIGIFQIRELGLDFSVSEWGFALGSLFWGTGIFEEAAALVADFAFGTLGAYRIEGRAVTENGRGNGALHKLGAFQEGVLREGLERGDSQHDQFMWGIIAEEWRRPAAKRGRYSEDTAKTKIETAIAEFQAHLFSNAPLDSSFTLRAYPFFVSGRAPDDPDADGRSRDKATNEVLGQLVSRRVRVPGPSAVADLAQTAVNLVNLSMSGALVRSTYPLWPGSVWSFHLVLPEGVVAASARVVRCEPLLESSTPTEYHVGIAFDHIATVDRNLLEHTCGAAFDP